MIKSGKSYKNYLNITGTILHEAGQEMIQKLKDNFESTEKNSVKMQCLTKLSKYLIKAKTLVKKEEIPALPNLQSRNIKRK